MSDQAARRYYAVLIRDHHARLIEQDLRAMHSGAPWSDERLGEMIREELDNRGLTIEKLMEANDE